MIISILNQKGGAGKTTLTTNLARSFSKAGEKVLLVDSDPQGSARDWHAVSDGTIVEMVGLDRPTLDKDIKKLKDNYDWIFIDGAPQIQQMAAAAIKCSDIVLIPVQPSPYDIWATADLVDVIKARQEALGSPKAAFVISRQIANTTVGKEVREALNQYDLPVFSAGTVQRIIYVTSATKGLTVLDLETESEAVKEILNIATELRSFAHANEYA